MDNNQDRGLKINILIVLVGCILMTSVPSLYKSVQIFTNASAQNSTFNLGTPFFVEHYKVIHVQNVGGTNGTSKREASFIGNGTANGVSSRPTRLMLFLPSSNGTNIRHK